LKEKAMNVITFKGERDLKEVTNRVYRRLTPRQREKAEAAILKANPQLRNIRRLPKGTVLKVPDIPELQAKRKSNPENPILGFNKQISESLETFSKHFSERSKAEKEEAKKGISLLKDRKFKSAIANNELLSSRAKGVSERLTRRAGEVGERDKAVRSAIKQMLEDLKG